VALIASGCGGSGDSPTRAEFIKEADAICRKAQKKKSVAQEEYLLRTGANANNPLDLSQQIKLVTTVLLPALRSEAEELSELSAPDPGEEKANAVIEGFQKKVEELEDNPSAMTSFGADPFKDVSDKADKYGFKACILYY
jgi:hypothetical protein